QYADQLFRQILEPPCFIRMDDLRLVFALQPAVKRDDTSDESGGKDPDTAIVQEIETLGPAVFAIDTVIAEMGIPMDHPIPAKRLPPGSEQALRNEIAFLERMIPERQERVALEPVHRQEPLRRQFGNDARHS